MTTQFKRTKAVDIVGRWVYDDDKITKYDKINANVKCSKCNGTDSNCPICKGNSIEIKYKWYQLIKKLKNKLKKK